MEKEAIVLEVIEKMNLSAEEVKKLVAALQKNYGLVSSVAKSEPPALVATPTKNVPLGVLYEDGSCLAEVLANKKPIGIVITVRSGFLSRQVTKLVLYKTEFFTRSLVDVEEGKKLLPGGYRWHLVSTDECKAINRHLGIVNTTLSAIGGDVLTYKNYATSDNTPHYGYTRYVAVID